MSNPSDDDALFCVSNTIVVDQLDLTQAVNLSPSSVPNLKLSCSGDYQSLKNFVKEKLNITGEWSSPGGKKKQFTSGNVLISWWKNKKFLAINGEKSSFLVDALLKYIGENYNLINNEEEKYSSPCRCGELSTDIEGIKLT